MWQFLIPIIGQLAYGLLFGGQNEQRVTQETTTETPPSGGFKDPGLGLLAPLLLGELSGNVDRFRNFGMPGGSDYSGFLGGKNLECLLALLQKEYEGISGEYGKPTEEGYPDCVKKCNEQFPGGASAEFKECVRKCRETAGLDLPKKGTAGR